MSITIGYFNTSAILPKRNIIEPNRFKIIKVSFPCNIITLPDVQQQLEPINVINIGNTDITVNDHNDDLVVISRSYTSIIIIPDPTLDEYLIGMTGNTFANIGEAPLIPLALGPNFADNKSGFIFTGGDGVIANGSLWGAFSANGYLKVVNDIASCEIRNDGTPFNVTKLAFRLTSANITVNHFEIYGSNNGVTQVLIAFLNDNFTGINKTFMINFVNRSYYTRYTFGFSMIGPDADRLINFIQLYGSY